MDENLTTAPEDLLDIRMRFWVELGRARVPLAHAVALGPGAIVDLDQEPDQPVEIYVNGRRYGTGCLVVQDNDWAVRIESIDESDDSLGQVSSGGSTA